MPTRGFRFPLNLTTEPLNRCHNVAFRLKIDGDGQALATGMRVHAVASYDTDNRTYDKHDVASVDRTTASSSTCDAVAVPGVVKDILILGNRL